MQSACQRSRWVRSDAAILAAVLIVIAGGCGQKSRPPLGKVHGRVTFNGKPLPIADVTFISANAARQSYGRTNQNGEFTLTTYEPDDGAILGPNRVTVVQNVPITEVTAASAPDPETYFRSLKESAHAARVSKLPTRYADAKTSGLSVTVAEGSNEPLLELRD